MLVVVVVWGLAEGVEGVVAVVSVRRPVVGWRNSRLEGAARRKRDWSISAVDGGGNWEE